MTILILLSDIDYQYKDKEDLKTHLENRFSYFGYKPEVTIDDKFATISVPDGVFKSTQEDLNKAFAFCEKQQFDKAEPLLKKVVETCPLQADAYRTLAQIYMNRGDYDTAINYNIEALKVDPGNLWALILMGNIMMRKGDLDAADGYYNKVLEYHPDDGIALNNIAANYMQRKDFKKAIELFEKAIKIDVTYMNSYYGISVAYEQMGDLDKAFDYAVQSVLKGAVRNENPKTREECLRQISDVAQTIVKQTDYMPIVKKFADNLEVIGGKVIEFEKDNNLKLSATLQYATTHQRGFHKVVYNASKPIYCHYLLHELTHLEMNIEASKVDKNCVVYSSKENIEAFYKKYAANFAKVAKKFGAAQAEGFKKQMHQGISLQLMNCPLDLLVEDRIHKKFPSVRPLQFMGLFDQEVTNIKSVEQASKTKEIPYDIIRQNKIMNIVTALHLKELYGVDLVHYYKPTKAELDTALDLYEEYKAYRDDYKPGEEYEMVRYFIEQLGSNDICTVENENDFKKRYNMLSEEKADTIEPKSEQDKREITEEFKELHKDGANPAETMMMAMYMLGALQYFDGKPVDDIRKTAMEIAMVGVNGISPDKKGYKVASIDREFGGWEFLAYYYVSWALSEPHMLHKLGLPFDSAYETAKMMFKKK